MESRGNQRAAFTLIELLIVVAIIGLLASLLLPTMATAKSKAQRVRCLTNERQIGFALAMYPRITATHLPFTARGFPVLPCRDFAQLLAAVHSDERLTLLCPADRGPFMVEWMKAQGAPFGLNR